MDNNTLVIIGGDAAGMSAAAKVRRVHKDKKILVFEKSAYTSYSACGIPYFISGVIESADELIRRSPQEFREKYDIDVKTEHLVQQVDTAGKRIRVLDKQNNTNSGSLTVSCLLLQVVSPIVRKTLPAMMPKMFLA